MLVVAGGGGEAGAAVRGNGAPHPPAIPAPEHGGLSRRSTGFPPPGSGSGHRQPRGSPRHWWWGVLAGARCCRCGSGGPGHPLGGGRVQERCQQGPWPPLRWAVGPAGWWVLCCRSSVEAAGRPGSPVAATRGLVGGRHLQGRQELDPSNATWGLSLPSPSLAPSHTHPLPCSLSPSLTLSFPSPPCPPSPSIAGRSEPCRPLCSSPAQARGLTPTAGGHMGHPGTALLLRGPPCPPSVG